MPDGSKQEKPALRSPESRRLEALNLEVLTRESLRRKASLPPEPAPANDLARKISRNCPQASEGQSGAGAAGRLSPPSSPDGRPGGPFFSAPGLSPAPRGRRVPELEPGEMVRVEGLGKTFVLHLSGPAVLDALDGVSLSVKAGSCLALTGPSGSGKSTLLRCVYGNYALTSGDVFLRDADGGTVSLSMTPPRGVLGLRRGVMGYVSQFLRVVPRVPALEVVMEPLLTRGVPGDEARRRASDLLDRLRIPRSLQELPPATFSGGERQRVNIARGLVWPAPVLLLDEPTASLDRANRNVVCELVEEAKAAGAAVMGVFHDKDLWTRLADEVLSLRPPGDN